MEQRVHVQLKSWPISSFSAEIGEQRLTINMRRGSASLWQISPSVLAVSHGGEHFQCAMLSQVFSVGRDNGLPYLCAARPSISALTSHR